VAVGEEVNTKRKSSKCSNISKDGSEKNSKGSNGSYNEFCKDTLTWLEEDVFCAGAPKATVDSFEDDEIVSSFSKFNQLMEKLKETKMSDLSDFDDKHDEGDHAATNSEDTKKVEDFKTQTNSSSDNTSNSSSADQVNCDPYTQICSSEEGDCCVSPLLGTDSSPEISTGAGDDNNNVENPHDSEEDSDTEIDVTAFKKLILSSAISDDVKTSKKIHCQNSSTSPLSVSKTASREKSKLDKKESEFLI